MPPESVPSKDEGRSCGGSTVRACAAAPGARDVAARPARTFHLACVCLLGYLLLGNGEVRGAEPTRSQTIFGHVTKVLGPDRVIVNRGKLDGLRPDARGLDFFPLKVSEGGSRVVVNANMRLALGHVVALREHEAEVALEAIADSPKVGDVFGFGATFPAALVASPLFRVLAFDILLMRAGGTAPFCTLAEIIADASGAKRTSVREAMKQDVLGLLAKAKEVQESQEKGGKFKYIVGGRFDGKKLHEVAASVTVKDIEDMLEHLSSTAASYVTLSPALGLLYFEWALSGTPMPEDKALKQKVEGLVSESERAAEKGDFEGTEGALREALKLDPGNEDVKGKLKKVVDARMWREAIGRDKDDLPTRWSLMKAYYEYSAYEHAWRELDVLEKAGYEVDDCQKYRAYIEVRQEKFDAAIARFKALVAKNPKVDIGTWIPFAETKKRIAADPRAAAPWIDFARSAEDEKYYDVALQRYQKGLELARTPGDIARAREGQRRVALLKNADKNVAWAKGEIEVHDITTARKNVTMVLRYCEETKNPKCAPPRLKDIASKAFDMWENAFCREIRERLVALEPEDASTRLDLAWVAYTLEDYAGARKQIEKAIAIDPKREYAYHTLARIHLDQGDVAKAREYATIATRDKTYAWPRWLLAKIALIDGDFEKAHALAKEAHGLNAEDSDQQAMLTASWIARQAAQAIAAGKDVDRNRMRLARLFVNLELRGAADKEIAKLPRGPHREAALRTLGLSFASVFPPALRVKALEEIGVGTPFLKRRLELLRAQIAFDERKDDPARAVRLARAYIAAGYYRRPLVVLGALKDRIDLPEVMATARLAREALVASNQLQMTREAAGRSDLQVQEKLARTSYDTFKRLGAMDDAGSSAFFIVGALTAQGRHKEAIAIGEALAAEQRRDGNLYRELDIVKRTANARSSVGSLEAVTEAIERTRRICEADDNYWCLADAYQNLAYIHVGNGLVRKGLEEAKTGIGYARKTGVESMVRGALATLGDNYLVLGELTECLAVAKELHASARKAQDPEGERFAQMLYGAVAMRRGDQKTALARFEDAYQVGRRIGSHVMRATARLFAGRTALDIARDYPAAAKYFQQAVELYAAIADKENESRTWKGLGEARAKMGDRASARKDLDRALALARELDRKPYVASILAASSRLETDDGKVEASVARGREAVQMAAGFDEPSLLIAVHFALGKALIAAKRDEEALAQLEKAVAAVVDSMARMGGDEFRDAMLNVGDTRDVFRDAIDTLIRLGKVDRALELLELSHDANLRRIFDPSKLKPKDAELKKTLGDLKDKTAEAEAAKKALNEELAKPESQRSVARVEALSKRMASSDGEMRQLLLRLKRDHRALYSMLSITPESIADLRESLPRDALVLEYFVATDALYIFVITREQKTARAYKVPVSAQDLETAVYEFRKGIDASGRSRGSKAFVDEAEAKPNPPPTFALSRKLYGWLIAPVQAELTAAKTTMIVPFGALHYLPFQALVTNDDKDKPVYLLEKHRLSYLSSSTIFKMLKRDRAPTARTLLAFANPDKTLQGAREEVERVQRESFPKARVLIEGEATKARFFELASQFRIVHFATHGVLKEDPLASHLKMAADPLTVDEITLFSGLEGNTDLVVLSACATAIELGKSRGDELISIASAFSSAGAPALVASLWDVDDGATSELMAAFYKALQGGKGMDTLEALRSAQLGVMRMDKDGKRPYAEPSFWAAFQLIGDYR